MVKVGIEVPALWRKPSATAIPSTLDKRTSPTLAAAGGAHGTGGSGGGSRRDGSTQSSTGSCEGCWREWVCLHSVPECVQGRIEVPEGLRKTGMHVPETNRASETHGDELGAAKIPQIPRMARIKRGFG